MSSETWVYRDLVGKHHKVLIQCDDEHCTLPTSIITRLIEGAEWSHVKVALLPEDMARIGYDKLRTLLYDNGWRPEREISG